MTWRTNPKIWLVVSILLLAAVGTAPGQIIYVDADANGANNGTSWANAYSFLQDALTEASSLGTAVEISVAQGIYEPDANSVVPNGSGDRVATFQLIDGVILKGGYAGFGEPDPDARDVTTYGTILSGDLDGNDVEVDDPCDLPNEPSRAENSYHVVTGSEANATAILDGFIITGGNADEAGTSNAECGGGMINIGGSPTITNCTFTLNTSTDEGSGMYNADINGLTLTGCTFSANVGWNQGGGMCNMNINSLTLTDCMFVGNATGWSQWSNDGSGMYNRDSNVVLTNCIFRENLSGDDGGGMFNYGCNVIILTNCMFSGNLAGARPENDRRRGGGIHNYDCNSVLINCTFSGNKAAEYGGGIYNDNCDGSSLKNCILWGNIDSSGTGQSAQYHNANSAAPPIVNYSCIQGGWSGAGGNNTSADPLFADAGSWDDSGTPADVNDDFWVNGDYHLQSKAGMWDANTSAWVISDTNGPCIDAGDPNSDWSAELWPHGKRINMGAYGGTPEASMSLSTAGNIADFNANNVVDGVDLMLLVSRWLREQVLLSEDVDRDGFVDSRDFAIFANEWFWEEQ